MGVEKPAWESRDHAHVIHAIEITVFSAFSGRQSRRGELFHFPLSLAPLP